MKRKKIIIAVCLVVLVLIILLCIFAVKKGQSNNSNYSNKQAYSQLVKHGYEGSAENFIIYLICEENGADITAYDMAVNNGYKGTLEDWLSIMLNKDGELSTSKKNSYDAVLEYGFTATEEQWLKTLESINETESKTAYILALENGFEGTSAEWLDCLKGYVKKKNQTLYKFAHKKGFKKSETELLKQLVVTEKIYGVDKKTTYDLAVFNGFEGSFIDWLNSLSTKGINSEEYKKFYSIAIENGFKGSKEDWDKVISEETYKTPYEIAVSKGFKGNEEEFKSEVKAALDNKKPKDSIIANVSVDDNNHIIVEFDDSTKVDIGDSEIEDSEENKESSKHTIKVENVDVSIGSKDVKVAVLIKNNPGILGMALTCEYDSSVMTLKSVENGEAVSDVLTLSKSKTLESGCRFAWDGIEINKNEIKDGKILIMHFDVYEDAKEGKYPISLKYEKGDIVDGDLKEVGVDIENGIINIAK